MMPKVFACGHMKTMPTFSSCKTIINFVISGLTNSPWECALHIGPMAKGHDVKAQAHEKSCYDATCGTNEIKVHCSDLHGL